MSALWRWPVRALSAHVLLFAVLALTAAAAARAGGPAVLGGIDPYLGGSVLYFVLLLPLVLVLGLALGVVAGGALQLWGARPMVAATVVGVTAAALVLAGLSWFDGWEQIPVLTVIAYGGPVALLAGLLTVRDARRLGRPRHLARARPGADLAREGTPAAG
ncbi:MAG TPA: hypothetical protein VFL10_11460 [Ornithinibacter sp.]|nr:hypothetical protein [Ornithinibacter sp.]